MKRKIYSLVSTSLCLLVIFFGMSLNAPAESPVNINRISTHSSLLNTKIIIEANAPLNVKNTYFSKESPETVVIELDNAVAVHDLAPISSDTQLIKGIAIEKRGGNQIHLLCRLKEQVPYRIYSSQNQTIIELNKIQRNQEDYVVDADIQKKLAQKERIPITLNKVTIAEENDRVSIRAQLSQSPIFQVFALDKPLRLVVDLMDTQYPETAAVFPVEQVGLEKLRVAQFKMSNPHMITRMVFDMKAARPYSLNTENNDLILSFYKSQATPKPVATAPVASVENAPAKESPKIPVNDVMEQEKPKDILKEKKPEIQAPAAPVAVPNASSPAQDKPAPREANAPARTQAQEQQEQEERYKPKIIVGIEEKYTGEIISLKFKDADLRDVVLYLGEFAQLNVVFDPEVRGQVTCDLEDVPWDQALDIILKINKMGKVLEGNVLRIAPMSVLTREDEDQRKLRESKELAGPVHVKTITLSYSKAREIQALLSTKKSPRGEIIIDERTNTLIISDVKDNLDLLEKLISVLDTPTPQVSIEARIVEATSTSIRNLGIQWGFLGISDPFYGNQTSLQFPNKILADGAMIPQGIVTKGIGGPLGGYAINLPAPAFTTAVGFSFANLLDTFRLDVAISALETSGEGRIISSPKVTTQNNQPAEIIQGRQIPVQTVANFTVTTRYVNAALELKATPQITAEGTIIMTIEIQNNAADFANLVNGIPPITTQSAKTTVMIPDGGTTVIGGIYRTEDSVTREKVPLLHKIPILGNLFRSFARTKQNRELLIFITPRIIK